MKETVCLVLLGFLALLPRLLPLLLALSLELGKLPLSDLRVLVEDDLVLEPHRTQLQHPHGGGVVPVGTALGFVADGANGRLHEGLGGRDSQRRATDLGQLRHHVQGILGWACVTCVVGVLGV